MIILHLSNGETSMPHAEKTLVY